MNSAHRIFVAEYAKNVPQTLPPEETAWASRWGGSVLPRQKCRNATCGTGSMYHPDGR